MRLVTYLATDGERIGAVLGNAIVDLQHWGRQAGADVPPTMLQLIDEGDTGLRAARAALAAAPKSAEAGSAGIVALHGARLLSPIPNPRRNIICLGRNYLEHALESASARGAAAAPPAHPVYFTKATTAINGPYDPIPYDASVSTEIDWEVELGVIIGRQGKHIPEDQALDHVFGYTVINDVTARDLQNRHMQWFLGKSFDGSCPMGPWIVTADELHDPHNLHITLRVNSVTKQDSNTSKLIFNINTCLSVLSRGTTLLAGDIIATGTPEGVGFARKPPEFLKPGDIVESEIDGIGTLRNTVEDVSGQK
jgi:2-keto-4-pentenoate hydratase/2-oxohepta-3-ene-1,7-dioic acid hydratase in catechol pathway